MLDHLRESVAICDAFGSPFTARLLERIAGDFEAGGGPVASLVGSWPGDPRADAVAMRLCGALHAAALALRDPGLASEYPGRRPIWSMDVVWPLARAFLEREQAWVASFIRSPPQTNETRRAIALLPGFLTFAGAYDRELELLEVGASAGLNLHWDRFRHRTDSWSWGPPAGIPIDTVWHGPPPPLHVSPRVRSRAGCDLTPLEIADPAQRLRLRAYIWADQHVRLARFDAAAELAIETGVRVERADAAEWLEQRLAARTPGCATLVYHSVFLQYPPRAARKALYAALHAAGERATDDTPLGWLRLEPEPVLGGPPESLRCLVDLWTWPGGVRRVLAITDGHAREVTTEPSALEEAERDGAESSA
jgi:hypothetical protein